MNTTPNITARSINRSHQEDLTELVVILDRSGSMASIADDAIDGFNSFVKSQCHERGSARLTLVLFDDHYEVPIKSAPLKEVPPIGPRTFVPRGNTALFDAIGRTLNKMTESFAARVGSRRPAHIIVAILTDGHENASRHYSRAHVADLIAHRRDLGWEFVFLAANQDAFAAAGQLNIPHADAAPFIADKAGAAKGFSDMNDLIAEKRRKLAAMQNEAPLPDGHPGRHHN